MKWQTSRTVRASALYVLTAALLAAINPEPRAGELSPSGWNVHGPSGEALSACTDGDVSSVWVSDEQQRPGMCVTFDLGRSLVLHRIVLTPGDRICCYPRALSVLIGDSLDNLTEVGTHQLPYEIITDLRFTPARGRYLRLKTIGPGAGYPWAIAEALLFGFMPPDEDLPRQCVITVSHEPLIQLAAGELSYYLSELAGQPIPLVPADREQEFKGGCFFVADPKGRHPYGGPVTGFAFHGRERVSVQKTGTRIVFDGPTQRAVLYAVYEFLHRQGVRWPYPDEFGDFVPVNRGIDLSVLPLADEPSFIVRYANWNTQRYESERASYLWYYRNRWNSSWGGRLNDRPGTLPPESVPGFGYIHTFKTVVPGDLYAEHPDWFPMLRQRAWAERVGKHNLGKRIPYGTTWGLNFCTSNPEVVDYVAERIVKSCRPADVHETVGLVPMDAGVFCECDRCLALDDPTQLDKRHRQRGVSLSSRYMTFITQVAERVAGATPNVRIEALAYYGYVLPPRKPDRLPSNVVVDVCQYGVYNLPLGSPRNAEARETMEGWVEKWDEPGHVGVYDWVLFLERAEKMPVPLVTALADRTGTFRRMGVWRIGTQANAVPDVWKYNPWNFYAYSRLAWNANSDPDELLHDFFNAYYREAGGPMLRYYRVLENHLLTNDVPLGIECQYQPAVGAFTRPVLNQMRRCLEEAEKQATHWVVQRRVGDAREGFLWVLNRAATRDN